MNILPPINSGLGITVGSTAALLRSGNFRVLLGLGRFVIARRNSGTCSRSPDC